MTPHAQIHLSARRYQGRNLGVLEPFAQIPNALDDHRV